MALTFTLVCHETKQKIWVGQGHHHHETHLPTLEAFYSGDEKVMEALCRFLNATLGKPLMLVVEEFEENKEVWSYEEFK